jgi:N-acylneuraminate cytidylyltransferase
MMKLAVIPARGGSKRIPRKNIKEFCGKPIIAWSIQAALESRCFDRVIVSTDDKEIAEVARNNGAEVPFMRPPELSNDFTPTIPVISHAISWFRDNGISFKHVCCIYATAPFVAADDIKRGLEAVENCSHCDYALSITSYPYPIQRAVRITKEKRLAMLTPEYFNSRSQDLEEVYHDAGQFYWGITNAWVNENPFFTDKTVPIIVPRHRVQDIDTVEDWIRAELMFKVLQHS